DADKLKTAPDDPIAQQSARPDFAILLYPVITIDTNIGKSRSAHNLLGANAPPEQVRHYCADQNVTAQTPPLFIFHARDDKTISYHQSELMATAAERAGVVHELTLIDHGGHGFGLGTTSESRSWYPECLKWLRANHLLKE